MRLPNGDLYISEFGNNRIRRVDAATGSIETVVGTGEVGYRGDGGPGTQARIWAPQALAADDRFVYFGDSYNHCFRRYDPATKTVSTAVGTCGAYGDEGDGGPATRATFGEASGIAVSRNGDLYVADSSLMRIRKVDAKTGIITAFAGSGMRGDDGDGGPATAAKLDTPRGLHVDAAGNLYFADSENDRVKVVDAATGKIRTFAGKGKSGVGSGDGGPATQATFWQPTSVAVRGNSILIADITQVVRTVDLSTGIITKLFGGGGSRDEDVPGDQAQLNVPIGLNVDASGNVYYADNQDSRVRRWIASTGHVFTLAGSLGLQGDGGPAVGGEVGAPQAVIYDAAGNLYIGGGDYHIHRVDKAGIMQIVAGNGCCYQNDVPGNETGVGTIGAFALDTQGRLLFAESSFSIIRRYDPVTQKVSLVAGTQGRYDFAGDGGPATAATLSSPTGLAADAAGNVYIADRENFRIRRIDPNGIITTIGGTGTNDSTGDGGPATQASFRLPAVVALDKKGRLLVTETFRVRAIDLVSGIVTTLAGGTDYGFSGDGGPATQATLADPFGLAVDAAGNIFISDEGNAAIRVIDAQGIIRSLNKPNEYGFSGDGGPVSEAGVLGPGGLTFDPRGALVFAERNSNRVRRVNACVPVGAFTLNPISGGSLTPTLTWSASSDAFRYDVYLDTSSPPSKKVASDVAATSFQAAGLAPGTTYYAKVTAKGDPYCPNVSTRDSSAVSFSTSTSCVAPGSFDRSAPTDGATGVVTTPTLSWSAAPGASSYDVYLGTTDPPPLLLSGITATSVTAPALTPGNSYFWRVLAKAACDAARTTSTATGRFTVAGSCSAPGAFTLAAPANGATSQATRVLLRWNAAPGAATYDVYLGAGSPSTDPVASGLSGTSFAVAALAPGASYSWRVVAHSGCDASKTTAAGPFTFTVSSSCATPAKVSFDLKPPGAVTLNQSYVVSWTAADGLDAAGFYRVERSLDAAFSSVLDSFDTAGRSASFTYGKPGTVFHRVTPRSGCGAAGASSDAAAVTITADRPRIVVARQPQPVIVPRGGSLANVRVTFDVSNVSQKDFAGFFNTSQPIPFFRPTELTIALRAGETKTYTLEYTGVPVTSAGKYDGLIYVTSLAEPLDLVPYATVALAVTPESTTASPTFGTESAAFAATPATSDPQPITVTLKNPGSTPMALSGEVGPEVWLSPDPDWNKTPLAPGESRTVALRSQRVFGAAGGVFPRYTYFTVTTKEGGSSRLLVRDETPPETNLCDARSRLAPGASGLIVPSIVKATSQLQNTFVSKLSIGNLASDDAVVDLFYTPDGADGFDCTKVLAKRLTVAAGDVLALTDPLATLFQTTGSGSLEIRSAKLSQLSVTGSVEAPAKSGGAFGFVMPAVPRGAGAVAGAPNVVSGLQRSDVYRSNMILSETSGEEATAVKVTLYGADGAVLGSTTRTVASYGKVQFPLTDLTGGAAFANASATIEAVSGRGAVQALVTVIDNTNDDAATYVARPFGASNAATSTARSGTVSNAPSKAARAKGSRPFAAGGVPFLIPAVVNGYASTRIPGAPWTFQTSLSITNGTLTPANLTLTYRPIERGSPALTKTLTIPPHGTLAYDNALVSLFGITGAEKSNGPMGVEGDTNSVVVAARVFSVTDQGTLGDALPIVPLTTEKATGARNAVTLETDGLENSIDLKRGIRSNLILTEMMGQTATVTVQLWEKGDRRVPIATKVVTVGPLEKVQLSPVFQDAAVSKDRTNVRLTVKADPASLGKVVAMTTRIDNVTGDTKNALVAPVGAATAASTFGF